jgi:hypothetical protein
MISRMALAGSRNGPSTPYMVRNAMMKERSARRGCLRHDRRAQSADQARRQDQRRHDTHCHLTLFDMRNSFPVEMSAPWLPAL